MAAFLQSLLITTILSFIAYWIWREAESKRKERRIRG